MTRLTTELPRFTPWERANHWLVAISFILMGLSGLAFFHPAFWPLVQLFGGGVWARILHPYAGLLLVLLFAFMFFRYSRVNRMRPEDWEWLRQINAYVGDSSREMPPQDKFNAGQKLLFWSLSACLLLLLLTGMCMWRAFFTLPVGTVRLASVVHAAAGVAMIGLIFGHIYAAFWTKGSIRAMVRGTVSSAWARHHHAAWYRQLTGR